MKVMSPFLHRTEGKSDIDGKDTYSDTNLLLIINVLLLLRQIRQHSERKKKDFQTWILFFSNKLSKRLFIMWFLTFSGPSVVLYILLLSTCWMHFHVTLWHTQKTGWLWDLSKDEHKSFTEVQLPSCCKGKRHMIQFYHPYVI